MAKLGTEARPAVCRVQTQERARELLDIGRERGWQVIVGVEPNKPEDVPDVEALLNPGGLLTAESKVGRNDPCPCGSGKKSKRCCGGVVNAERIR